MVVLRHRFCREQNTPEFFSFLCARINPCVYFHPAWMLPESIYPIFLPEGSTAFLLVGLQIFLRIVPSPNPTIPLLFSRAPQYKLISDHVDPLSCTFVSANKFQSRQFEQYSQRWDPTVRCTNAASNCTASCCTALFSSCNFRKIRSRYKHCLLRCTYFPRDVYRFQTKILPTLSYLTF